MLKKNIYEDNYLKIAFIQASNKMKVKYQGVNQVIHVQNLYGENYVEEHFFKDLNRKPHHRHGLQIKKEKAIA